MDVLMFIGGSALGASSIYFTAYLKVKGKNKGLSEDIKTLESQKQEIAIKYKAELEEIRKKHSLEIEKRKYQYEDKRAQFTKYFALLDEFHSKSNSVFLEKFNPLFIELMSASFEQGDTECNDALVSFTQGVQIITNEINEEYLKIKTEQNSIRLIASREVDSLLDELESSVKIATDKTTELIKLMSSQEYFLDQTIAIPYMKELETEGKAVMLCRDKLKERMKVELDTI